MSMDARFFILVLGEFYEATIGRKKDISAPVGARQELRNEWNIKRRGADCESDPEDWWVEKVNPYPSLLFIPLKLLLTNDFYCFSSWFHP